MDTIRVLTTVAVVVNKYLEQSASSESNVQHEELLEFSSSSDSESNLGDVSCDSSAESDIERIHIFAAFCDAIHMGKGQGSEKW